MSIVNDGDISMDANLGWVHDIALIHSSLFYISIFCLMT